MSYIQSLLLKQKALIIDGALGTQLQNNGHDVNDDLWSAKFLDKNPEVIKEVHEQYLQAGADCIITASYQASIEGFIKKGYTKAQATELIQKPIHLAKEARDDFWQNCQQKQHRIKPLVAASIGPYGAYLANGSEYTGEYGIDDETLRTFHQERLKIILQTKPDILAIETMPLLKEVQIICEVLKNYAPIPTWVSFSAKDENYTNANDSIIECFNYLENQDHIDCVGINCTKPRYITALIQKIKTISSKPIIVYPNGGSVYNPITKIWGKGDISAQEYAKMAYLWYQEGAKLLGGCCETTPLEIKEIRKCLLEF